MTQDSEVIFKEPGTPADDAVFGYLCVLCLGDSLVFIPSLSPLWIHIYDGFNSATPVHPTLGATRTLTAMICPSVLNHRRLSLPTQLSWVCFRWSLSSKAFCYHLGEGESIGTPPLVPRALKHIKELGEERWRIRDETVCLSACHASMYNSNIM